MPSFRVAYTLLAALAFCTSSDASAFHAQELEKPPLQATGTVTGPTVKPSGAVLSTSDKSLVNQIVAEQRKSGLKWDLLAAEALQKLTGHVEANGWASPACDLKNARVRREWGTLTTKERRDYIDAVLCLQKLPSKLDRTLFPGARTRYDDFVGVHINQSMTIHLTGNFLTWHRYFTWAYEEVLRNECGYKGTQPYYNWAMWAENPKASPLLDGSDTSMSGDGRFYAHGPTLIPPQEPTFSFPAQDGGGCINSGPFVNWTVNLGPVAPDLSHVRPNPLANGTGYNPRCIIRDISPHISKQSTSDGDIHDLITQYTNIGPFQNRLQGDFARGYFGVHSGGHYTIRGDPGGDFFTSPGDPYFFFHHSAIERVFWTWQNLNLSDRTNVIADTLTFNNTPPSRPATLRDPLDLGVVGTVGVLEIQNATSTLGGNGSPFCYIYA